MIAFLLKRLGQFVFTLLCVATLIFFMLRVLPGDPVEFKYTSEGGTISAEQLQAQRARFGYDKPLSEQYLRWIGGLLKGDLGVSIWSENPIHEEIGTRLGITVQLALAALVVGILLALPLGIAGALTRGTWLDQAIRVFTVTGQSLPSFWLAMLVLLALLATLGWIPSIEAVSFREQPGQYLAQLLVPAVVVGWRLSSVNARLLRSSLIEVLGQDYVRTARAKGMTEKVVVLKHVLRNSLIPVVTVIALGVPGIFGGAIITEQVFKVNGLGQLLITAIYANDLPMVQTLTFIFAILIVLFNLIADLLYGVLDPRIRYD